MEGIDDRYGELRKASLQDDTGDKDIYVPYKT